MDNGLFLTELLIKYQRHIVRKNIICMFMGNSQFEQHELLMDLRPAPTRIAFIIAVQSD